MSHKSNPTCNALQSIKRCLCVVALSFPYTTTQALVINVNDLTGGTQSVAVAAFNQAADSWESIFTDDVTVNIDFDFSSLGANTLGSTSTQNVGAIFSTVKSALSADITSTNDVTAVANLPAGTSLSFRTNDTSGAIILDQDGSGNNTVLNITRANAKALGLTGFGLSTNDTTTDATIMFSSDFNFDFNAFDADGINGFDFIGVAIHEIGHVLGFTSGVDTVDITTGTGPIAPLDINGFRVVSVLDLFRYSADSIALGSGVLDLATGGTPYFSIDGGMTNLGLLSTGRFDGDGQQASHFKDNLGLGILDPTLAIGELGQISVADQLAFDAIGWDFFNANAVTSVPTPSTLLLLLIGWIASRRFILSCASNPSKNQPT